MRATNMTPRPARAFSPRRLFAITIAGIALAEVLAMIVVYFFRSIPYYQQVVIDAAIMTVIIYPLLYLLSFKLLLEHIQQRNQMDIIHQARLRLMDYSHAHTLDELLQFSLDEIETLTGSTIGFFHFLEPDQETLYLQAWSTNTLQNMCRAEGKNSHYKVGEAGVWADAVRQRKSIIHNEYAALPDRKGMPEGHAQVMRELVIPILRDGAVVAVLGVGNKPVEYTDADVKTASTLADFAWDSVEQKRSEDALRSSEEKFRTLVDWTYDWEKWIDPSGKIVYTSPSCERITGYTPEELIADPGLLVRIVHPENRQSYEEHMKTVHDATAGLMTIEYVIISRDGSEHWIEHICRPLFGPDDRYLGRRVSSRDITARKQAEKRFLEQKQIEESLTQAVHTLQTDIARDLHDTLGQNISYLRMNLEHLSEAELGDIPRLQNQLKNLTKAANESYDLIRAMLDILQSGNLTDTLSLYNRFLNQIAERSGFEGRLTSQGRRKQLSQHQNRQLFYIFREALSNIEKYAHASRVACEFNWEEHVLKLTISDDGRGFDPGSAPANGHYGLKFMQERAGLLKGSLFIHSSPGEGTMMVVSVPYDPESAS